MKFLYEYKTSDNERREGQLSAASRDAAYAELKRRGIRPSKVVLAPGFLNRISSFGKRGLAIAVLAVLCVTLVVIIRSTPAPPAYTSLDAALDSSTRRQIIGDSAVIEEGIRTGWADVFEHEGDRFLASFAVPGTEPAVRSTTEEEIRKALEHDCRESLRTSHSAPRTDAEGIEARQIRAMVEGMKDELRQFLADKGTIVEFGRELVKRQQEEIGYYERAKGEIEAAQKSGCSRPQLMELWQRRNAALRGMGVKLVPLPE